jgi:glycine cleavage system H protein
MTPEDRKYTRSHEWVKIEDGIATVGITDHAQESLGDITYIELPETEYPVQPEEETAVVESVKAASDIYAPVAGTICEVNQDLMDRPEIVNEDPYGNGWIFKIADANEADLEDLFDASEYDHLVEDEH